MITGDPEITPQPVSCVIPVFNASNTIERAVLSVLVTKWIGEIIIVDDGSTDNSSDIIEALAKTSVVPIIIITQENAGAAAARNTGMAAAKFEWVAFLDADDEMIPDSFISKFKHLSQCKEARNIGGVHGGFTRGDNEQRAHFTQTMTKLNPDDIGRQGGFPGGVVSFMFRRSLLLTTNGFRTDLVMFEDFEFILRLIRDGARLVGNDTPGFKRHYTPDSLTRGKSIETRLTIERLFLKISSEGELLSRFEVFRRRARNRARQIYFLVTGR